MFFSFLFFSFSFLLFSFFFSVFFFCFLFFYLLFFSFFYLPSTFRFRVRLFVQRSRLTPHGLTSVRVVVFSSHPVRLTVPRHSSHIVEAIRKKAREISNSLSAHTGSCKPGVIQSCLVLGSTTHLIYRRNQPFFVLLSAVYHPQLVSAVSPTDW